MGRRDYDDEDDSYDERYGERFEAPADFDGPVAERGCTDVLFALLMVLCWLAMTGIGKATSYK